jgi:hypothetical protein
LQDVIEKIRRNFQHFNGQISKIPAKNHPTDMILKFETSEIAQHMSTIDALLMLKIERDEFLLGHYNQPETSPNLTPALAKFQQVEISRKILIILRYLESLGFSKTMKKYNRNSAGR